MIEINNYEIIMPLFNQWKHNMVLSSIAIGNTKARFFVNDVFNPRVGVILYGFKMLVLSYPQNEDDYNKIYTFFQNIIQGQYDYHNNELLIFWQEPEWEALFIKVFKNHNIWINDRSYYELNVDDFYEVESNTFDYEIIDVNKASNGNYKNNQKLHEEMCSESANVDAFLRNCFGYCAIKKDEIVGFCLSEYNCQEGFEIGISVEEDYRRQGIATELMKRMIKEAKIRHKSIIGWSCFSKNIASVKTASKVGLKKVKDYKVLYIEW